MHYHACTRQCTKMSVQVQTRDCNGEKEMLVVGDETWIEALAVHVHCISLGVCIYACGRRAQTPLEMQDRHGAAA